MLKKNLIALRALTLAFALIYGCAKPPTEEVKKAKEAIKAAEEVGAPDSAPTEWAAADEANKKLTEQMNKKKYRMARKTTLDVIKKAEAAKAAVEAALEAADKEVWKVIPMMQEEAGPRLYRIIQHIMELDKESFFKPVEGIDPHQTSKAGFIIASEAGSIIKTMKPMESPQGLANIFLRESTIHAKPPLYHGAVPFRLIERFENLGGGPGLSYGHSNYIAYYAFEKWNNIFSLHSTIADIPQMAFTIDNEANIAAIAKILKFDGDTFEVLEVHYGPPYRPFYGGRGSPSGPPIFKCNSQFDMMGFKQNEDELVGKRERDYYFIWPVGASF